MNTFTARMTGKREVTNMLDDALELLLQDLSCKEALEYCADAMELTRILEGISENLACTVVVQ
jgi:hypothetical protein